MHAVLCVLNGQAMPQGLNHTHVVLIPKKQGSKEVVNFWPISLCNVLYNLMTKVITNRLKHVLPSIISKNQSAFTPGYFITDNILVAFEIFHSMNGHVGENGFMTLKLDMSKVYDKVEWIFLRNMMLQLGFRPCWVNLIMSFVEAVTYLFVVNGELYGFVAPTRGIRQGDPISPYLFLFCAEGL